MKFLIELLCSNKDLPLSIRIMLVGGYFLWTIGTACIIFGWMWSFCQGQTTIKDLAEALGKMF